MMSELPTLASAYKSCVQEERHKEIKQVISTESLAFMANKRKFTDKPIFSKKRLSSTTYENLRN